MLFPQDQLIDNNKNDEYKRLQVLYKNKSDEFLFKQPNDYSKQFSHIYAARLSQMRKLLQHKIKQKWGTKYPIKKMFELREDEPQKCVIIGTLFKYQQYKPSILREISEENQLAPPPPRHNYVDESDKLILEDELQRIRLQGNIDLHFLVTGVVCAVLGTDSYQDGDSKFIVEDSLFHECGPQRPLKDLSVSPLLVLISGLDQSSTNDFTISLELLQQWLYGNIIGSEEHKNDVEASNIVRIIVAGNSIRSTKELKKRSNFTRQPESTATLRAVNAIDEILSNWSRSVFVDLMPGEFDPANYMLPQQPMHNCMFPKCLKNQNFQCVTNPYRCEIEHRLILGTSGQNILDIEKFSKFQNISSLETLRTVAKWGHIAPTCPDTLSCFPYYNADPFIIGECPHVFFCGNTNEYQTDLHIGSDGQKIRLVCVPSFSKTQNIAVVNLRTLDCQLLNFSVDTNDE